MYIETWSERTSDSLNEGLPIKMTREKFQRKIWVENSVFAIQLIENRKSFTEVLSPPVTKLILLYTVVVLHFTHHIKTA